MSYNTKYLLKEAGNLPVPQYYNAVTDAFEPVQGAYGAGRVLLYDVNGNPLLTAANPGVMKISDGTDTLAVNTDGSLNTQLTGSIAQLPAALGGSGGLKTELMSSGGIEPSIANVMLDSELPSVMFTASNQFGFNETSWDRWRNNTQSTLLSNITAITGQSTAGQTNHNAKGVILTLNIASITTGASPALTLDFRYITTSGATGYLWNETITPAVGTYSFVMYPDADIPPSGYGTLDGFLKAIIKMPLPRTWYVVITPANVTAINYTLDCSINL